MIKIEIFYLFCWILYLSYALNKMCCEAHSKIGSVLEGKRNFGREGSKENFGIRGLLGHHHQNKSNK